ncbi:MAG: methionyl-tRNA formyltransferase [Planctomycetaceae bacterium]
MNIGWVGVHAEGIAALQAVCEADYDVVGFMTLKPQMADRRCGSADYDTICDRFSIPVFEVDHVNDSSSLTILQTWDCDLLVVLGWGQILNAAALKTARLGVVGAHASLLPHNRGSAPVNWAIIHGEPTTGNSLIWLEEDVDAGGLIDQRSFPVSPYDTCSTIYDRVAESNAEMLLKLLSRLELGEFPGRPQPESAERLLPRRRPEDGQIHWDKPAIEIYNLIRAVTRPYPGARTVLHGRQVHVWKAALLPTFSQSAKPGTVLGPVMSPVEEACGIMVATVDGAIVLLEVEDTHGRILNGRDLCEDAATHMRLHYAA